MYTWWPRILPYIGTAWVCTDRYGEISPKMTQWESKVFILAYWNSAIIVYQFGVPRRIESDDDLGI